MNLNIKIVVFLFPKCTKKYWVIPILSSKLLQTRLNLMSFANGLGTEKIISNRFLNWGTQRKQFQMEVLKINVGCFHRKTVINFIVSFSISSRSGSIRALKKEIANDDNADYFWQRRANPVQNDYFTIVNAVGGTKQKKMLEMFIQLLIMMRT